MGVIICHPYKYLSPGGMLFRGFATLIMLYFPFYLVSQKYTCHRASQHSKFGVRRLYRCLLCSLFILPDLSEPRFYPLEDGVVILPGCIDLR